MSRKLCKNIKGEGSAFYIGTEPSPKGRGYCARYEKIGTKMKGKDGNIWVVQSKTSGTRAWIKAKTVKIQKKEKEPSEELLKGRTIRVMNLSKWNIWQQYISREQQIIHNTLMKMSAEFNRHGINVYYCLWQRHPNGYYISDDPWNSLIKKDRDYLKKPYIIIPFKMIFGKFAKLEYVCLQHTLTKKWKPIVDDIMFSKFRNLYQWNGSSSKAICIAV